METFSALLALSAGNSPVSVNSPHKGQWRGALMFSLIYAWINDWVNNREAGDLRRHRGHYDVNVMRRSNIKIHLLDSNARILIPIRVWFHAKRGKVIVMKLIDYYFTCQYQYNVTLTYGTWLKSLQTDTEHIGAYTIYSLSVYPFYTYPLIYYCLGSGCHFKVTFKWLMSRRQSQTLNENVTLYGVNWAMWFR